VTAAVVLSAEEAERRELAAQDAERAAWIAWECAYGQYEAARSEHVRALRRER
jgi:hypothetical protein